MIYESLARMRTHRSNIHRYRAGERPFGAGPPDTRSAQLFQTELTELERQYVERRLSEERAALDAVANTTLPFGLPSPRTLPEGVSTQQSN
ncbi:hypothetical protein J6524_18450 [Bradyrhizobium sp. WSM 1738]|uniref:hypothetical protein n=1 Tax=Bradyrhizobium hereditatis TaxID=2821405 RepID=UPI001CE319DB|nr:hypothetical protein [Bradyrhizobium hereditatis]MCA6116854.1 hypothetical protein [Bradyrhizobium hereditatis]